MRTTHTTTRVALGCAVAMLSLSGSAFALTTKAGTHVSYTWDETALGYFGSADVIGDSLVFTPVGFAADANNPWVGWQVNVTVEVLDPTKFSLASFSLDEGGSYSGYVSDPSNITIGGGLNAIDAEGNTSNQIFSAIVVSGLATGDGDWTGAAAINLPATGWGGGDGVVGKVDLQLFNDLIASGAAEVRKTGVSIDAVVTPVPEADITAMLLAGVGLVGFMARRRRMI